MQGGQAQGMQTMDMALERYVRDGTIALENALEKAIDKESFAKAFKKGEMDRCDAARPRARTVTIA